MLTVHKPSLVKHTCANARRVTNALLGPGQKKSQISIRAYLGNMNTGLVSRSRRSGNTSLPLCVSSGGIQQGGSRAPLSGSPAELVETRFDLNEL